MRILITGASGNLGHYLLKQAPDSVSIYGAWHQHPAAIDGEAADLADEAAVARLLDHAQADLVIHTAFSYDDMPRNIVQASELLAKGCARENCPMIYISSDMIFDGQRAPWDEGAAPCPISDYGRAKAEAEARVQEQLPNATIIRNSLIIGLDPMNSSSAWFFKALEAGEEVTLYEDEIRSPIDADDLACQVWEIALLPSASAAGIWHLAGPEHLSRYELGMTLIKDSRLNPDLIKKATCPPERPRDLRLDCTRSIKRLQYRTRRIADCIPPGFYR